MRDINVTAATANLTPEEGVLASFGSGNGSRAASRAGQGAAGRRAASAGRLRAARGQAGRIGAVGGRGRNQRRAAVEEFNRVVGGSRRPTNRELNRAIQAMIDATGYR